MGVDKMIVSCKANEFKAFGPAEEIRSASSGVVAGNVKEEGMREIERHGPFEIHGDVEIMQSLDALLRAFVDQRRMKIDGDYRPCYRVLG